MQKLLILLVFVGVFEVTFGQALTSEKAIKQFFQEIGTYSKSSNYKHLITFDHNFINYSIYKRRWTQST